MLLIARDIGFLSLGQVFYLLMLVCLYLGSVSPQFNGPNEVWVFAIDFGHFCLFFNLVNRS